MNVPNVRTLVCHGALALILLAGCNKERSAQTGGKAQLDLSEPPPSTVVATYAGKTVTEGELDQKIADQMAELEQQFQKQKFELKKQALDNLIMTDLVKQEAQKRGQTDDQFMKAEVDDKVPTPPEEQMKQLFEASKAQLPPGATFEQFKPQIEKFLTQKQRQDRARAVFTDLREKAHVEVKLQEPLPPKKDVEAVGPAKGPASAPVTIVEFSDFQCPFCSRAVATVDKVMEAYPGKVRLVFRNFPLTFHEHAPKAAEAAQCANEQGKFWEYHDVLFHNQQQLEVADLKKHAASIGLDAQKFDQCLDSGKFAGEVKKDTEAGQKLGINGTPAFFINGRELSGAQPFEEFQKLIDAELTAKK